MSYANFAQDKGNIAFCAYNSSKGFFVFLTSIESDLIDINFNLTDCVIIFINYESIVIILKINYMLLNPNLTFLLIFEIKENKQQIFSRLMVKSSGC